MANEQENSKGNPGPAGEILVAAVTSNEGNFAPTDNKIKATMAHLRFKNGELPDVVQVATQEEFATKRKQKYAQRLCRALNEAGNDSYVVVELKGKSDHTTGAGMNNQGWNLKKINDMRSHNRCANYVIVKESLLKKDKNQLPLGKSTMIFGKNKNKSIITSQFAIKKNGKTQEFELSGMHLDSHGANNRLNHVDAFFEKNGYTKELGVEQIAAEASKFRIATGDMNTRREWNEATGAGEETLDTSPFRATGFNMDDHPTIKINDKTLPFTYGGTVTQTESGQIAINDPIQDPKRPENAKEGVLDTVAVATGREWTSEFHGFELKSSDVNLEKSEKKLHVFHNEGEHHKGSDHVPIVRRVKIMQDDRENEQIARDYTIQLAPKFTVERKRQMPSEGKLSAAEKAIQELNDSLILNKNPKQIERAFNLYRQFELTRNKIEGTPGASLELALGLLRFKAEQLIQNPAATISLKEFSDIRSAEDLRSGLGDVGKGQKALFTMHTSSASSPDLRTTHDSKTKRNPS